MKRRRKTIHVEVLDAARRRMRPKLISKIKGELKDVFSGADSITVCHYLAGYSENQEQKVVLAVQVRSADDYRVHTVKLGDLDVVGDDFTGWKKCLGDHRAASHIFLRVDRKRCADPRRLAIVYEDAYTFYGEEDRQPKGCTLESAAIKAVKNNLPAGASVERVIRQISCELRRCLYRDASPDQDKARKFYRHKLRTDAADQPGIHSWKRKNSRYLLRKDLIWLLHPLDNRAHSGEIVYLDPYDYVMWALGERDSLPRTLVGRSHGDLHGRNVVVGVERGEAEFPLVFDYGDMSKKNVLAWDFAKLETEIKVRLLPLLYRDESVRKGVLAQFEFQLPISPSPGSEEPKVTNSARVERLDRLRFAHQFESLLAEQSDEIDRTWNDPIPESSGDRSSTGNEKLGRALGILLRIREEAAISLGELHQNQESWRDEYNFALAVYGLCTAKFHYTEFESACALVSAGVACARIHTVGLLVQRQISQNQAPSRPFFCYQVPLARAHRLWAGGAKSERAQVAKAELLAQDANTFAHAVPLLQEYGLALIEIGRHREALSLLAPLEKDCVLFRDHETLSRIGRTWKDHGDGSLEKRGITFEQFSEAKGRHPSWQFYSSAARLYRAAYEINHHYYPGVNVATLSYLLGNQQEAERVAQDVLDSWIGRAGEGDDLFWILASEGEASLIVGDSTHAAEFYRTALSQVGLSEIRMVRSAYNQMCRLYWALGRPRAKETLKVFKAFPQFWSRLGPGPLGDCDNAHKRGGRGSRGKRPGPGGRDKK